MHNLKHFVCTKLTQIIYTVKGCKLCQKLRLQVSFIIKYCIPKTHLPISGCPDIELLRSLQVTYYANCCQTAYCVQRR